MEPTQDLRVASAQRLPTPLAIKTRLPMTERANRTVVESRAAVQRILRHSDPKLTTDIYGHLAPEYLRAEVDRLSFGIGPAPAVISPASQVVAPFPTGFVPLVSPNPAVLLRARNRRGISLASAAASPARDEGVEPTTFGSGGQRSIQLS